MTSSPFSDRETPCGACGNSLLGEGDFGGRFSSIRGHLLQSIPRANVQGDSRLYRDTEGIAPKAVYRIYTGLCVALSTESLEAMREGGA